MNENVNDMNSREQIIEQIFIVESSQRYSKHVKFRLEHFKRPAAVKKIDYSTGQWLRCTQKANKCV